MQVFTSLADCSIVHWTAQVSYVEVYNEAFHDLLAPVPADLKLEEVRWVSLAGVQRATQACSAPLSLIVPWEAGFQLGCQRFSRQPDSLEWYEAVISGMRLPQGICSHLPDALAQHQAGYQRTLTPAPGLKAAPGK